MFSGFKVYVARWQFCVLKNHGRFKEKREKRERKSITDLWIGLGY